ncbi:MAG: hypothetical protein COA96_17075 [SAR86 cluster bacterium]|uniref:Uncharacterized protein n=1 Tax=SAR86 cluster bacterium TaxID=2030880 RepID=A0A2A5AGW5_9GAMM|nr:MAG: hypothetical protein COA96_17075 [SAR86 cluster bacterium]
MATYTTLPEATTAALSNLDYASSGSIPKAQACRDALNAMLLLTPKAVKKDGADVTMSPEQIEGQLTRVNQWLLSNDTQANGGGVKHLSLGNFRG